MPNISHVHHRRLGTAHKLTRNNLEFAGLVVYFFALAVAFAITIIVMMCQTGSGANEKAGVDQHLLFELSTADYR